MATPVCYSVGVTTQGDSRDVECKICQVRLAEHRCATCGAPICPVCGIACDRCGRWSCTPHVHWTPQKHAVCHVCESGARPAEAPGETVTPASAPSGGMSFEALQAELGSPPPSAVGTEEKRPEPEPAPQSAGRAAEGRPGIGATPDPNRLLTASAQRGTPLWVSALFVAGLSWVLLIPLVTPGINVFHNAQPYMSYSICLLALGAVVWSFTGLFSEKAGRNERRLCLIGLAMGLIAAVVALLVRQPPPPY